MIEITSGTDWDTVDDPVDLLRLHDVAEREGFLRTDLKALLNYTGSSDLSAAVKAINTKKVLEIGVGGRFEALVSLYRALLMNNNKFPLSDIWAVDSQLDPSLAYPEQKEAVEGFTKIYELAQPNMKEIFGKFDLVLAKGVLSIGSGILREPNATIDDGLKAIGQSLNPSNPNAMAIISSKTGLLLPLTVKRIIQSGLKPVYFMDPTRIDQEWEATLRETKMIDSKPFKLVICQRL